MCAQTGRQGCLRGVFFKRTKARNGSDGMQHRVDYDNHSANAHGFGLRPETMPPGESS
jgi:hypothetical protein